MTKLAALPVGTAVINPRRHDWRPLLNHGWVEAAFSGAWENHSLYYEPGGQYLPPLRVTADGLRALADAIDKHGQPGMLDPQTQVEALATYEERRRAVAA
jgi:hypothetical protein